MLNLCSITHITTNFMLFNVIYFFKQQDCFLFIENTSLHYVQISFISFMFFTLSIFCLGVYGLIQNKENLIFSLISMELILLSISLSFTFFSVTFQQPSGQIFSMFILGIAASEAALGLSLILIASKTKTEVKTINFSLLKG